MSDCVRGHQVIVITPHFPDDQQKQHKAVDSIWLGFYAEFHYVSLENGHEE
jgi:hypothetical protein